MSTPIPPVWLMEYTLASTFQLPHKLYRLMLFTLKKIPTAYLFIGQKQPFCLFRGNDAALFSVLPL